VAIGPVTIADHTRDASMAAIAGRILAAAQLRAGWPVNRRLHRLRDPAPGPRPVARLALLDTTARPDTPEQTQRRLAQIALARGGRFAEVLDLLFPVLIHRNRQNDVVLGRLVRLMADDIGPRRSSASNRRPWAAPTRSRDLPASAARRWSCRRRR
jgi:hypothetical protein